MASHKILVIDDSRVIRVRVKEMLPAGNFEVLEAKDGLEGLNLIRQEQPNLIMLDFLLPKLSGWEVFQQIQAHPDLQKIPLVLMSGRKEEVIEKIQEPFEYFEFILKPFQEQELIGAIKSAMIKAKLPREAAANTDVKPKIAETSTVVMGANETQILNEMTRMHMEIDTLKQQMAQVITFIRQKVK